MKDRRKVSAGELRHSIDIQIKTESEDALGGSVGTWSLVEQVWGRIEPLSEFERNIGAQQGQEVSHKITMRYYAGLTTAHRILAEGTRIFGIVGIKNVEEADRVHVLKCVERADVDN